MRNRIAVSPMCQYSSIDGGPTDFHLVHLGRFALGGAGLVFMEDAAVEERGRSTHRCAGMYARRHAKLYQRITSFLKAHGSIPAAQLGHSGRKASTRPPWQGFAPLTDEDTRNGQAPWRTISSSRVAAPRGPVPEEMELDDIRTVMRAWRNAALLALDSGFDICEVHGAHGYLIHQFLSPAVNKRTDAYGGDLAGRMRFVLEVLETVRSVWPKDKPLFFRVSATDGASGSWDLPDTIVLAKEAKLRGVDVVDCSSGGISGSPTVSSAPRPPGYQVPFAEQIRREAAIMTMAVGLITEASQAEAILQHGQADLIALGRQMLYDPHWAAHAAEALGVKDCFDYLPACQSWWLKRWEKQGV